MHFLATALALGILLASSGAIETAQAKPDAESSAGAHGFDFEFGNWRVHHRIKRADGGWTEFDGTCTDRALADGSANVEEHRFDKPTGVTWGIATRAFDPKSGTWAIWWIDGRDPHGALDPPVKGRFEHGVGTFYSDGVVNGKPVRTRYVWSEITRDSAHWEQAYSDDAGKTWDTNWTMDFRRVP